MILTVPPPIDLGLGHAPITVAIVSTNHLVRLGLQAVLSRQQHIRLIGDATSTPQANALVARKRPQVLVIETGDEIDILELVRTVKSSTETIRIILLSGLEDKALILRSVSSGIDGIVLNTQPAVVLLATIHHVCALPPAMTLHEQGLQGQPIAIATSSSDDRARLATSKHPDPALTGREQQIIRLIGLALSNKDIAERLRISSITVRHHLTNIFGKLDVNSRQQLLLRAHEYGLVKLSAYQ